MIAMDDDLFQVYKETHYTVQDAVPFVLHIGVVSEMDLTPYVFKTIICQ